jgi:hypothetical protein
MKKITIQLLLAVLLGGVAINSIAQVKIKAPDANTGQKSKDAEKRIIEIATKKAAADKILKATLVNIEFSIYNSKPHNSWFKSKEISMKGNGASKFNFPITDINGMHPSFKRNENGKDIWGFPKAEDKNGGLVTDTYESFLKNGFTVNLKFSKRGSRIINDEFSANFSVTFIFSDGNKVEVPLQGLTYGTNPKGSFTAAPTKDFVLNKSYAGTEFPDPNNPVTTPIVK